MRCVPASGQGNKSSRDSLHAQPQVGVFGVLHPEVLSAFEVTNPVSALEINLEPFCFDQRGRSLLQRLDADCS